MVLNGVLDDRFAGFENHPGFSFADRDADCTQLVGGRTGGGSEIEVILLRISQNHRSCCGAGEFASYGQDVREDAVERYCRGQLVGRVKEGLKLGGSQCYSTFRYTFQQRRGTLIHRAPPYLPSTYYDTSASRRKLRLPFGRSRNGTTLAVRPTPWPGRSSMLKAMGTSA